MRSFGQVTPLLRGSYLRNWELDAAKAYLRGDRVLRSAQDETLKLEGVAASSAEAAAGEATASAEASAAAKAGAAGAGLGRG